MNYGDLPCMHGFGDKCDCYTKREKPVNDPSRACECGADMDYTGTMGTVDPRPTFYCGACGAVKVAGSAPSDEMLQRRTDSWSTHGLGW